MRCGTDHMIGTYFNSNSDARSRIQVNLLKGRRGNADANGLVRPSPRSHIIFYDYDDLLLCVHYISYINYLTFF